jgi:hypothetical protein
MYSKMVDRVRVYTIIWNYSECGHEKCSVTGHFEHYSEAVEFLEKRHFRLFDRWPRLEKAWCGNYTRSDGVEQCRWATIHEVADVSEGVER